MVASYASTPEAAARQVIVLLFLALPLYLFWRQNDAEGNAARIRAKYSHARESRLISHLGPGHGSQALQWASVGRELTHHHAIDYANIPNRSKMTSRKVLMLCCSESGHSNVYLATVHSLLEQDPSVELHLGSFARLGKTLEAATEPQKCSNLVFHPIQGPPIFDVLDRDPDPNRRMLGVARLTPGF